ncbi:MAG: hypothetical protein M3125_07025 [Gemmatimonadota bacterium]|nr:hypothetical protein [Gemmatimonadota bacterium]
MYLAPFRATVLTSSGMELLFERVYTIDEWDEGPRSGVANFAGVPHYFRSVGDSRERFELTPLPREVFELILEADALFHRWHPGPHTLGDKSFDGVRGVGGAERARYETLQSDIAAALEALAPVAVVRGDFDFDPDRVRWSPVDGVRRRSGPSRN